MTNLDQFNQQFSDLADQVRRRIRTSPPHSHTARIAQQQLDDFTSPLCSLSVPTKVEALTTTLRDFKRGLQFSDPILHHPGDRKPGQ